MKFMPAAVLTHYDLGRLARGCGIVTARQRPETDQGVVFVTLEDETGDVNVVIWPGQVEQQRREVMRARLLGGDGQWQSANSVTHLVAKRLVDLTHLLGELGTRSRDFHQVRSLPYFRAGSERSLRVGSSKIREVDLGLWRVVHCRVGVYFLVRVTQCEN